MMRRVKVANEMSEVHAEGPALAVSAKGMDASV